MGTLGGANSEIDGANRVGDWVGAAQNAKGKSRAVLWHDGAMIDLGEPGAWAADITNAGVVVGNSSNGAFTWYRGIARLLPIPAWATGSYVRRINQHDDAVGALFSKDGEFPTEWQHLTHPRVLPVPSGFNGGEGLGINDAGDVVGDVSNDSGQVAWEWGHDGTSYALQPEYQQGVSQANVVNDRGWAAGGLDFGGQIGSWAAVWRHSAAASKLGQLGRDKNFSFAYGQDQLGDYVGAATYTIHDHFLHVFITRVGMGHLLTMLPLSGDPADRSHAHAAVPSYQGEPGVAVGGDSVTANGDDHATVWTCAYQQAFVPIVTPSTLGAPGASLAEPPSRVHSL